MGFGEGRGALLQKVPLPLPNLLLPFALRTSSQWPWQGMMPVAAADTMLPDTPGGVARHEKVETDVSGSLDVATCVEKNMISGA